jgi:hypothetical protein
MLRVADRPAAHAGLKLHKFNPNRRGERPRFIAALPIDHELRGGRLLLTPPLPILAILLSQPFHWRHWRFRV